MKRISIWGLIVIPFVLLTALGGMTLYLFSTVTISNVSDNISTHYMHEIEARVYDRVTEFMAPLGVLVELNREAIAHHPEWLENLDVIGGRLYEQAVPYPYMTFVSFATADGRYINSTRDPFANPGNHHLANNYTESPFTLSAFEYDPVDYVGERITSEQAYPNYDPRTRPFYQDALTHKGMTWSAIAPYFGFKSLGVGLSAPVYSKQGELLGVMATSVALVALDTYMQSIKLVDNSYIFLADAHGDLIATSEQEDVYQQNSDTLTRTSLSDHNNEVLQQAGQKLETGTHRIEANGQGYLYHVRPVALSYGQTWYVGVLIPESYYQRILSDYSQALLWIVLGVFLTIALIGWLVARFIGKPIHVLNEAVNSNSLECVRTIPQPLSRVSEIQSLGKGMQSMAEKLSDIMQNLEQKVAQRTSYLKDANDLLHEQSTTDELTSLYNRRGFNLVSEQALRQAQQDKQPFCMVLCDIDHFKQVNDTLGHVIGDQALVEVARILKQHFREEDIVARYGGEEFMLITVGMAQQDVIERLHEVRHALIEQPVYETVTLTLSYGVTYLENPMSMPLSELINGVDAKLYQAKNTGRDKIVE